MKINIITIGKLKEKYLVDCIKEYQKRISRYHNLQIIELEEEKLAKSYSDADVSRILVKEGLRIIKNLTGFVVVLDKEGKNPSSEEFAKMIDKSSINFDTITFVIGSSFGLSEEVKSKAHQLVSFSKMTFPHQLFRTMLLEQIYRSCTITNNVCYHK